jgi:hypothetical protein
MKNSNECSFCKTELTEKNKGYLELTGLEKNKGKIGHYSIKDLKLDSICDRCLHIIYYVIWDKIFHDSDLRMIRSLREVQAKAGCLTREQKALLNKLNKKINELARWRKNEKE